MEKVRRSTSMVWPTLGSRKAKEQNRTAVVVVNESYTHRRRWQPLQDGTRSPFPRRRSPTPPIRSSSSPVG